MRQTKQLFGSQQKEVDEKYNRSVDRPQYKPSNKKPNIAELTNTTKYSKLIRNINESDLPEEEKQFLRLAASRHIVFNYSKIADYYAHSDKELQELMEQSALVILDIEDAIKNGYVRLTKNIEEILKESGKSAKDKK